MSMSMRPTARTQVAYVNKKQEAQELQYAETNAPTNAYRNNTYQSPNSITKHKPPSAQTYPP